MFSILNTSRKGLIKQRTHSSSACNAKCSVNLAWSMQTYSHLQHVKEQASPSINFRSSWCFCNWENKSNSFKQIKQGYFLPSAFRFFELEPATTLSFLTFSANSGFPWHTWRVNARLFGHVLIQYGHCSGTASWTVLIWRLRLLRPWKSAPQISHLSCLNPICPARWRSISGRFINSFLQNLQVLSSPDLPHSTEMRLCFLRSLGLLKTTHKFGKPCHCRSPSTLQGGT